jgi:hypothetical protein
VTSGLHFSFDVSVESGHADIASRPIIPVFPVLEFTRSAGEIAAPVMDIETNENATKPVGR